MFTPGEFRKKALAYGDLVQAAIAPDKKREFQVLEQSFTQLANNEQWLADNHGKTIGAMEYAQLAGEEGVVTLEKEEEHILRCLGAALIMQWNTLPRKLRRELFDNAGSMGELMKTSELRRQIARFLHKHKDDKERESPNGG
jgi:flagellar biosynthesis regulator FlaF